MRGHLQRRRDELMADADALCWNADRSVRLMTLNEEEMVRDILAEVDRIDVRMDAAERLRRRPVAVRPTVADEAPAERATTRLSRQQRAVLVGRLDFLQARFGLEHPWAGREIRDLHERLRAA